MEYNPFVFFFSVRHNRNAFPNATEENFLIQSFDRIPMYRENDARLQTVPETILDFYSVYIKRHICLGQISVSRSFWLRVGY